MAGFKAHFYFCRALGHGQSSLSFNKSKWNLSPGASASHPLVHVKNLSDKLILFKTGILWMGWHSHLWHKCHLKKKQNKCWWISGLKITFLNQHSLPILIHAMEAELHIWVQQRFANLYVGWNIYNIT